MSNYSSQAYEGLLQKEWLLRIAINNNVLVQQQISGCEDGMLQCLQHTCSREIGLVSRRSWFINDV